MINRERQKRRGISISGVGGYADVEQPFEMDNWQVESFEVFRDVENPIDPNVINRVVIVYRNGAVDNIVLRRGLEPPVDDSVPDSEYINNLMIVEVEIETIFNDVVSTVIARIYREEGYGNFQRVELEYIEAE